MRCIVDKQLSHVRYNNHESCSNYRCVYAREKREIKTALRLCTRHICWFPCNFNTFVVCTCYSISRLRRWNVECTWFFWFAYCLSEPKQRSNDQLTDRPINRQAQPCREREQRKNEREFISSTLYKNFG